MWSISWLHYKLTTKRRKLHLVQWLENAQKQIQAEATLLLNELHFKNEGLEHEWMEPTMGAEDYEREGQRSVGPTRSDYLGKKTGPFIAKISARGWTQTLSSNCLVEPESPRTSLDTHVTPPIQSYTNHTRKCVRPRFHGVKNEENGGPRSYCDGLFKSSFHLFCLPCLSCVKNWNFRLVIVLSIVVCANRTSSLSIMWPDLSWDDWIYQTYCGQTWDN